MRRVVWCVALAVVALMVVPVRLGAQDPSASPPAAKHGEEIPAGSLLQPAELAADLNKSEAPLVLQVGPRTMYEQAHVLKAEYAGPGNAEAGLSRLRERVAHLTKDHWIVLYCGCCPWDRCPNIRPAFAELQRLGFTHVQALYLPQNFGADWVAKGYPTEQ